jgi:hypothetical protein
MGGSSSKVEPVVGPDALPEWYVPNPAFSSNRLSRPGNVMTSTLNQPPPPYTPVAAIPHFHRSTRQGDVFDSHVLPPSRRNGNNPYQQRFEDDEEMIRFVSMMSLAETRSPPQPSAIPRPRQPRARASQPNLKAVSRRNAITTGDGGSISRNTFRRPALKASSLALVTQSSSSSDEDELYAKIDQDFVRRLPSVKESWSRIPAPVERPASRLQRVQECSICIETKPVNEFPKVTSKCRHKATTCLTCLQAWISSELTALTWNRLKCFGDGCNAVLAYTDMKKHATPEVFEKFVLDFRFRLSSSIIFILGF